MATDNDSKDIFAPNSSEYANSERQPPDNSPMNSPTEKPPEKLAVKPTKTLTEILGFSKAKLEKLMQSRNRAAFHGRQIFSWMYGRGCADFAGMTDLSAALRAELQKEFSITPLKELERARSSDTTEKYLFALSDGAEVETALIPDRNTTTACVSSQVGCALACKFCATGTLDLKRNLTAGEIVSQLLHLRREKGERAFSNIVFMGMGEPLLNYDALLKALEIIIDSDGLAVAPRRITISTSGITPKIKRLAESGLGVNLAVSLHAATQVKRERIMPVAQTFALDKLILAAQSYAETVGKRITFEYVHLQGYNDTYEDCKTLSSLIRNLNCKVNILPYNPVPGLDFTRPTAAQVDRFAAGLADRGVTVTVRTSRGRDISAACGQLAAKRLVPQKGSAS